jgi:sec-independent protein translocase protein TatA
MGIDSPVHLVFIAAVALIVLGPKRLPALARALGQGIREFRDAMEEGGMSGRAPSTSAPAPPALAPPGPPPAPSAQGPTPTPADRAQAAQARTQPAPPPAVIAGEALPAAPDATASDWPDAQTESRG